MNFQEQLKQLHQQAKIAAKEREQAALAEKKQKLQMEQELSFAQMMADVQPIKNTQRYHQPIDKSPMRVRDKNDEHGLEHYFYIGEGGIEQNIPAKFSKNGQGSQDIRRLQAGYWEVVADVDLHGYNQEQAQQVLNEFIEFVQKRGVCGEIIHGSGLGSSGYQSVLKHMVRRWLMQHPEVLAYCEPNQHNDGAVRILLKRRRKRDKEN